MKPINQDDIKVTLEGPDDNHTPSAATELLTADAERRRMGLTVARLAAVVRLQYLQDKRDRMKNSALVLPMRDEENKEFRRLMDWWNNIGVERQNSLMLMAEEVARGINLLEATGGMSL